ncbi:MAG: primosomal protein N' family DNA-binding protein, partial [Polaribacter sp.]
MQKTFTYSVSKSEFKFLQKGMRIAVSFGHTKMYTGLVFDLHHNTPELYEAKEIYQILDETPIVNENQLKHWEWLSNYYRCTLGDVYRAALPSAFLLESETIIYKNKGFVDEDILDNEEFLIFEALENQSQLTVHQVSEILGKKKILPVINRLIEKSVLYIKEEIYEQYKPKLIKYVRLNSHYNDENHLKSLLKKISRAKKQRKVLFDYLQLATSKKPIKAKDLENNSDVSSAVIKTLVDKEIFEFYHIQTDRVAYRGEKNNLKELNSYQNQALQEIKNSFQEKQVTLLHGVTSSGKTEIYTKLIQGVINCGKQVLFLLPEIALTTQIIVRL